jgi:putative thiamine transport system permease protein
LALVLSGIALWLVLERLLARLGLIWSLAGQRWLADAWLRWAMAAVFVVTLMLNTLSLLGMSVWAFTGRWRFPAALPQQWSLDAWTERFEDLLQPFWTSVSVALGSALVSLLLAAGCLEHEARYGRRLSNRGLWLLYVPLVVPQIAFLFGTQVLLVMAGLDGTWPALAWSHLVFVLPYVYLALADPYRAWDQRYARSAACLGAPPARVLWRIKLPMLLRPLLVAWAVGFAVSIAQYLPTLFAGAGRLTTLTTEAVGLAAGGDRRLVGVYALLQMLLPLLAFTLALMIPGLAFRNRRGLQVAR